MMRFDGVLNVDTLRITMVREITMLRALENYAKADLQMV